MYITINDIQPLVDKGLSDVKIAKKLNLHKTTIGKIRKGIILKSRPIGIKKRIQDRDVFPIWDYIGEEEVYPLAKWVAWKSCRLCHLSFDQILDFVLDQMFFTFADSSIIRPMGTNKKRNRGILFNKLFQSVGNCLLRRKSSQVKPLTIFDNGCIAEFTQ